MFPHLIQNCFFSFDFRNVDRKTNPGHTFKLTVMNINMTNNTTNSFTSTPASSVIVLTYVDAQQTTNDAQNAISRDT